MQTRYAVVLAASVSLAAAGGATRANGEDCDPLDYVQPDPVALDVETVTATHIVEARLRRTRAVPTDLVEKDAAPVKGGGPTATPKAEPVAMAFGYPLAAADAEAAIVSIRRILKVTHTDYQKETLIVSAIRPDRFADYKACRRARGHRLTVELPERIATRSEYLVRLHWHPPETFEGDVSLTVVAAGATVPEGYYSGEKRDKPQEFRIRPDSVILLKVVRSKEFEDSDVVGSVGGESFRIEVPGRTASRLTADPKAGQSDVKTAGEDCEPPAVTSCVVADSADTPLLPGSFRWNPAARDKLEHVVAWEAVKHRVDEDLRICRTMAYKCQRPYGASWAINRVGTALQLKTVNP